MSIWPAIKRGDEGEVARLLSEDSALLEAKNSARETPLSLAVQAGHVGMVMLLQHRGVDVNNATGVYRETALHHAARGGHTEIVAFLLSKGAQPSFANSEGSTPLVVACMRGHLAAVEMLLQHMGGQRLNDRDRRGGTALHFAAAKGHVAVVGFLLSKGVQVNLPSDEGDTPLINACYGGHLGVVQLLLQHGGALGLEMADRHGRTPLFTAAEAGREEYGPVFEDVVALLLAQGARANVRGGEGRTPLMAACLRGSMGMVQLLVQHMEGQGLDSTDGEGRTALHGAAKRGRTDMVACLLGHGAQASIGDVDGQTALMEACTWGYVEVVHSLLQHTGGRGVDGRDWRGRTALHRGAARLDDEIVRALLLAGADPTITDQEGSTPRALMRDLGACVFDWWEGELERRYILHRARCLHDASVTHRDTPTAPLPALFKDRAAAGQALPSVEVTAAQSQQEEQQAGDSGNAEGSSTNEDEERHAVLAYVVRQLNAQLFTELMQGFHGKDTYVGAVEGKAGGAEEGMMDGARGEGGYLDEDGSDQQVVWGGVWDEAPPKWTLA